MNSLRSVSERTEEKRTGRRIYPAFLSLVSVVVLLVTALLQSNGYAFYDRNVSAQGTGEAKKFIKYVEFNPTIEALTQAYDYDVESYYGKGTVRLNWIELLAYTGAKSGGKFSSKRSSEMDKLVARLRKGEKMSDITAGMAYYDYYYEAYSAVLSGFLGEYTEYDENGKSAVKYGLVAYSPIAAGYSYTNSDDFGNSRTYGYARRHLGNDMFSLVGTPVVAVEKGIVEALGWNEYGGWRIGIRSLDGKRYYYYAHLRKNHPYHLSLAVGQTVEAGQVIGYVGRTGYSKEENTNNLVSSHLHFGMQLIFDESQKDSDNEIWIDVYNLLALLRRNTSKVVKDSETKDYNRVSTGITTIGKEEEAPVKVPILMYHSVMNDAHYAGTYVIPAKTLESDLLYLRDHGYTTVFITDLIRYVYDGVPLPEKPVVLTFDDGFYNMLSQVYPLLQKYNMKAVASVVGSYTDRYSAIDDRSDYYAHLTYEDIKLLSDSGLVEIQNHSDNLHNQGTRKGSMMVKGESMAHYTETLTTDISLLQSKLLSKTGINPNTFTYPYGQISRESLSIIKNLGFLASLSCTERPNYITRSPDCLYLLNRYNRPYGISTANFMKKALK